MSSPEGLVERYVAVWNEPDAERRRRAIASLWVEDGLHFTPSLEARGYEALEARITSTHDRPGAGGPIAAYGFDFFVLAEDGRIRCDYQFPEPTPPS